MNRLNSILIKTLIFGGFLILTPIMAFSATFKNANELNLPTDNTFENNTYLLVAKGNINSVFEEDLFLLAGRADFNGTVNGDLTVLGGQVSINGTVKGDLRIIGGEVIVNGQIENDLLVIGGNVEIAGDAHINGQSLFVGASTNLKPDFNNPTKIISARTFIDSEINSDLEVTTQNLVLGSAAKINHGMTYYAPKRLTENPGSVIIGQVNFNQITPLQDISFIKRAIINFVSFWLILKFVTTLLIAFILAYVFRFFTKNVTDLSLDSFGKSLLTGLLAVLATPLVIAFLIVSLVAAPIGFLLLILSIALTIIVPAISGILAGALIRRLFNKKDHYLIDFSTVAIGVTALTFIGFVAYLGDITKIILNLVAIGAVVRYLHFSILGKARSN